MPPRRVSAVLAGCLVMALGRAAAQAPDPSAELLRQGRELLDAGRGREAVVLLERHLGRVRSDPAFLLMLTDAYRIHLETLDLQGDRFNFEMFSKRLRVLEQGLGLGQEPRGGLLARGSRPDEESVRVARAEPAAFGEQAAAAFARQQYREAGQQFAKMSLAGLPMSPDQQAQWAYCKLAAAVERLNAGGSADEIEREAQAALKLAGGNAKLEQFGRQVMDEARRRAGRPPTQAATAAIRHTETASESANFRLVHSQSREFAEQMLQLAEQHRRSAFAKFASPHAGPWPVACEVVLHATGADYAKATGQPANSPGHSTIKSQAGRVTSRRIDLRADDPDLLGCVLPHEITHVVLGDLFPDEPLPRWADEGLAVLAEPRAKVDRYTLTMIHNRRQGKLVPLDRLLATRDYPDPAWLTVFYVQSVSVVEYLVNLRDPAAFVAFCRDLPNGTDAALQRHYHIRHVAELQERWLIATFTEVDRRDAAAAAAAKR